MCTKYVCNSNRNVEKCYQQCKVKVPVTFIIASCAKTQIYSDVPQTCTLIESDEKALGRLQ